MIGFINYWVDPQGRHFRVHNHADFAVRHMRELGRKVVPIDAVNALLRDNWLRIAIDPGGTMYCEFRRMNKAQWDFAENQCIEKGLRAVDDDGRELCDWRDPGRWESLEPRFYGSYADRICGLNG